MEVEEAPETLPPRSLHAPIDLTDHRPSVYCAENSLNLDNIIEMSVGLNGRLLFLREKGKAFYQVVDLACGSASDFALDENEFDYFDEFLLLPLREDLYSHLIICRGHQDENDVWLYKIARFQMDFADCRLKRVSEWTKIVESIDHSGSCFINMTKIYFLCGLGRGSLVFRSYNIQNGHLSKRKVFFNNDTRTTIWNAHEYKFRMYYNNQIYGFRRFLDHTEHTKSLKELYRCYKKIVCRRLKDGQIRRQKLKNSLECLEINEGAYDERSVFQVDGQWIQRRFYLQIRIRHCAYQHYPVRYHPQNYFALLDMDTRLWRPISVHMPQDTLIYPMQMVPISGGGDEGERLVFLRTYSKYRYRTSWNNESVFYLYDMYRVAVRTPTRLMTVCATKVEDKHRSNSYLIDHLGHFLFPPL